MIKISIIIPVFNAEPYVKKCLDSIGGQDYQNIECILVEDYSSDNSSAIIKNWVLGYKGEKEFKIIQHEQNEGVSVARNNGLNIATGNYIFFIDSDDWLSSTDYLSTLVKAAEANPDTDIIMGNTDIFDPYYNLFKVEKDCIISSREEICKRYINRMVVWGMLIKRSLLENNHIRFVPKIYHEDNVFIYELNKVTKKIVCLSKPMYFYNLRDSSVTTSQENIGSRMLDYLKLIDIIMTGEVNERKSLFRKNMFYTLLYVAKKDTIKPTEFSERLNALTRKHIRNEISRHRYYCAFKYFLLMPPTRLMLHWRIYFKFIEHTFFRKIK